MLLKLERICWIFILAELLLILKSFIGELFA